MKFRFSFLTIIFLLLFGVLGTNLYRLQIEKSDYYANKVNAMQERIAALELRRGQIFVTDRAGGKIPVSINKDYPIIFVAPNEAQENEDLSRTLAAGLDIDENVVAKALKDSKSSFRLLIEKASEEQIAFVKESGLRGVHLDSKQYRFYPFQSLMSHVVGFVGFTESKSEPFGLYGTEKMHDGRLADGESVYLTVDRNIQAHAEQTLTDLMKNYEAVGGTVIVQEPKTGKILALANKPDFDPNEYGEYPLKNFINPGVQLVYEPGSAAKPVTMSAGLELGIITPDTTFEDKGSVTLNGRTIRNAGDKVYGKITMTEVIENSVNTGTVFVEQKIGHANFLEYLKKFGFGEKTEIDLPDEVSGSLKNLEKRDVRDIDFATASFGQGIAVTPVQLVNSFSTIANGGLFMRPYINQESKPYVVRRTISEDTARKVTAMMESTVEKARIAAISGYRIAGKTGTAYIPDFKKGGYTEEMIHTFVGFAPASDPKFTVLVKLDKPQVGELAGMTVVPAFRDIAQFILNYYRISPDKLSPAEK